MKPGRLFYRKLQEYEATLPPGEVMFSPYRVKSLTIMDDGQEVFKSSGPARDMLGALRSAVPTPTMSATGVNFVASPPAATEGWVALHSGAHTIKSDPAPGTNSVL